MVKNIQKFLPRRYNPFHWRKMAYRDPQGLRNRAWLFDNAAELYEKKKGAWDFLLLYIDLRNFKTVNDKLSHSDGNEVLKAFYDLLEHKFRTHQPGKSSLVKRKHHDKDILVVREGGDEFVVFIPLGVCDSTRRSHATRIIAERLESLYVEHKGIKVTARIALVASTPDKPFSKFLDYFHKADMQLSALHKKEH